ncbi:MAG: MOSC domain-containing protein [Thermoflexales bacterium]|nr:MOSC domain-containing protein [Thermoflexales bacterium]
MKCYVSALYIYPIKSCRGVAVQAARATLRGLEGDRLMMVVDEDGHMLTQRELPRMALIAPRLVGDQVCLDAPDMPPLWFTPRLQGASQPVAIWNTTRLGVDQGQAVSEWLSAYLGQPARLVHVAENAHRATRLGNGEVAFADSYPYLVVGQASLDDLSARLGTPVPAERFRPNVVIAGGAPFDEDQWREVQIGDARLELVKPCSRCSVVEIAENDPLESTHPARGVLAALAAYRQREGKVFFGQNAVLRREGIVRVGDAVEVLTRRT